MKKKILKQKISLLISCLTLLVFVTSCKKHEEPTTSNDPCANGITYELINLRSGYYLETDVSDDKVNMLFQVLDVNGKGIAGLNDVTLYELIDYDDDMTKSPEANVEIDSFGSIPITVNTILLLDLSKSVEGLVPDIKQAALAFINKSLSEQKIAIYTFDGDAPKLRINFTNNKTQLASAINSLPETKLGTSTNLYEALIVAESKLPQEKYTISEIVQGNIMLFTDGKEEASPQNKQSAIDAVDGRTVFVAALQSNSLDENTLKELSGEGNYFKAANIGELEGRFSQIQKDIASLSKSVYWLHYQSPRKGNNQWEIELKLRSNCNAGSSGSATGIYKSDGF